MNQASSVANPAGRSTGFAFKITIVLTAALIATLSALFAFGAKSADAQTTSTDLTIDPTKVGFGSVQVGTTSDRTVTLQTSGTTSLTIGGVKFIDPTTGQEITGGPFSLTDPLPTGGLTVDPTSTTPVDLGFTFTPTADTGSTTKATAVFTDALGNILNDSAGNPLQAVDLSGAGVASLPSSPSGVNCTVIGTEGDDVLTGTMGDDVICGLGGNDTIDGQQGNDTMYGGAGNDTIADNTGTDKFYGEGGRDVLNSRDGQRGDFLKGGSGKDKIIKDKADRAKK